VLPSFNNTLNISRALLGKSPVRTNRERCRERIHRGFAVHVGVELRKAGIRGSPCCQVSTTRSTFRGLFWANLPYARTGSAAANGSAVASRPPLAQIFMSAGSGTRHRADPCKTGLIEAVRRVTVTQQYVQRFTCWFGRIPYAAEKHTHFADVKPAACAMRFDGF
jgi:hypothetical protein